MKKLKKVTPMMRQYLDVKDRYPDSIVFFRMGDFYEMFFEDAVVGAKTLDLTLTARNKGKGEDQEVPMAGVPHHSAEGYISKLVEEGFQVAICEQIEDVNASSGVVKRDVVRVVTPGVIVDGEGLQAKESNYVAALSMSRSGLGAGFGIAYLDVSTGDFRATEVRTIPDLVAELHRIEARELLVPAENDALVEQISEHIPDIHTRALDARFYDAGALLEQVGQGVRLAEDMDVDGYFLSRGDIEDFFSEIYSHEFEVPALVEEAASAVLEYIVETQRGVPTHIQKIIPYRAQSFLVIDEATKANLELTRTLMGGRRRGSLLSIIDETITAMGGRRLRQWLSYPLVTRQAIEDRLDAVEELVRRPPMRQDLRAALEDVYDIERLCGKITGGSANAKDLRALVTTLAAVPDVISVLDSAESGYLSALRDALDPREELTELLDEALVEDPPTALTEGGLFDFGYHPELDEVLELARNGKDWMLQYEAEQREETEISSLKVKYNKVFGYYLEVTKANLDRVPDSYIRKQTLANSERYYTPILKEKEEKILGAEERRCDLEYRLFEELRQEVAEDIAALLQTASELANLDVIAGLAELAQRRDYCRPTFVDDGSLSIVDGRHPVVETTLEGERFVPNSVSLDPEDRRLIIITGPNMSGKSTVIRQVALVSLLAQMGAYVPAKRAQLTVVDKIFSRVGASDNLARGQSTFMVEMTETAHILQNATQDSLVILDEIGRGTATFDGLSIAWAVAEHLHDVIGAKTLFATHYHELTERADQLEAAANMSIAAKEVRDDIIFLRKLVEGRANRSYGVQVGKLAGLPDEVVERARVVLGYLEGGQFDRLTRPGGEGTAAVDDEHQLTLFGMGQAQMDPVESDILSEIRSLDANAMTPIEALTLVSEWIERLRHNDLSEPQE